jgi:mono/diheme cytochrome c family protein
MNAPAQSAGRGRLVVLCAFLCGAATVVGVLALGGLATIQFGLFDTTATKQHGALVSWAAHTTFIHFTQRAADGELAPDRFSPDQVQAGLKLYVTNCELCHGGPATPRAAWVSGINPTPPFLLDSARRWSPAELHAVISNGVKMTAMPAWRYTLSDAQRWDLVAFLESLPGARPASYLSARAALQPSSERGQ